ncbi:MAG: hypothetical protein PHH98_05330 [Candidatus Gracilibacteria bacterium]|nr:hypothetical protein [Candidatus Gracilibacteria bacterium]
MNNIENLKNLDSSMNIDSRLNNLGENLNSINELKIINICEKADKNDISKQCFSLNNIFGEELSKKGINFKQALNKLENPIGIS